MSRATPRLPDPELLGTRPFGSPELGAAVRSSRTVVALSGGADSTALMLSLVRLRSWLGGKPPFDLVAAHFNHSIRGEAADGDEAFASGLCKELGVPFVSGRGDVPAAAGRTGESLEMAARRLRRDFLRRVAEETGAAAISTGHTLDDQAELFFLRLRRGASCRGLGGMPFCSPWDGSPALLAVKPLLGVRHEALCAWLRGEGRQWREDASNAALDADRNKIRHMVLPAAEKAFGASFFATLGRTMAMLRDAADVVSEAAEAAAPDPLAPPAPPGAAAGRAAAWAKAKRAAARERIARALYALGVDPEAVRLDAIDGVWGVLSRPGGGKIGLGNGLRASVVRGSLRLEPDPGHS